MENTQTLPKTETPPTDLEISRATAQLEKLTTAAADAEAEADRWRLTFEREPTAQAHTNSAVAKQKASNARADALAFERDTLQPLIASQRQAVIASHEAAVLNQQSEAVAALEGAFGQLVTAIEAFDSAIELFGSLHHARVAASQRGVGLSAAFSLQSEIARLAPRLDRFGGVNGHHVAGQNAASIALQMPIQTEAHLAIKIARNCGTVPMPTRAR